MLLSILLFCFLLLVFKINQNCVRSQSRNTQIKGAFTIPGYPLVGNTFQLLHNPSKKFTEWSKQYKLSTFVIYLGYIPVLVVNDRKDIEHLWIRHSTALTSRPTLYTFHNVISADQGPTIGTTPAGPSFRRKRKIVSLSLSAKALSAPNHSESFNQCSLYIIRKLLADTANLNPMQFPFSDISLLRYCQCYVLRCAVNLTYGLSLDTHGKDQQLADKIIETENHIINFRSFISNYQDYLPIFRVFPFNQFINCDADLWKLERDKYLGKIQADFEKQLQNNDPASSNSILGKILAEKSNSRLLTQQEARSLCLTMISAGLDNLGFTMNYIFGQFSESAYGHTMQERLFCELLARSDNDIKKAWHDAACYINCDFALAIVQEALRQLSVLPLGLPRSTTKQILLGKIIIPEDTVLLMNVFSANHDSRIFRYPDQFNPPRWLDEKGKILSSPRMDHFTFGLGSRRCAGDQLSIREMYTLMCRLVLVFRVRSPRDQKWRMEQDPFLSNSNPAATSIEPREFRVWLRARQGRRAQELLHLISEGL